MESRIAAIHVKARPFASFPNDLGISLHFLGLSVKFRKLQQFPFGIFRIIGKWSKITQLYIHENFLNFFWNWFFTQFVGSEPKILKGCFWMCITFSTHKIASVLLGHERLHKNPWTAWKPLCNWDLEFTQWFRERSWNVPLWTDSYFFPKDWLPIIQAFFPH